MKTNIETLQRKENQFSSGGRMSRNRTVRPICIFSLAVFCSILVSVPANFCQAQTTAGGTATIISGFVIGVTVTNGGSEYSVPPEVSFIGGGGSGAAAVAYITNGSVIGITNTSAGSGYTSPPTVVIEPPLFDLNNTLVGYWPFEGNVNDASGKGANGSVVGSISYPAGAVGTGAAISGSSYVEFGDPSDGRFDIGLGQDFSVSIWVKTTMSGSSWWPQLLSKEPGAGQRRGLEMAFMAGNNGQPRLFLFDGNASDGNFGYGIVSPVTVNNNQWRLLIGTKQGTTLSFYVDGVLMGATTCANTDYSTSIPLRFGRSQNTGFATYQGAADELRIYKRALEPREIKALAARLPVITHPQSALAYWGRTVCFSTTAIGAGTLTYQWFKGGQPMPQGTNATLCITNAQATDAGVYSVTVSNSFGTVYSQPATLTVNPSGVAISLYPGITIDGVVGQTYGVQSTTNLSGSWTGIANITLTTTPQLWYDSQIAMGCDCQSVGSPRRFYRVVPGPITVP